MRPDSERLADRLHWGHYPFLVVSLAVCGWAMGRTIRALPDPGAILVLFFLLPVTLVFAGVLLQNALNFRIMSNKQMSDLVVYILAAGILVAVLGTLCLPLVPSEFLNGPDSCGKPLSTIIADWLKGDPSR